MSFFALAVICAEIYMFQAITSNMLFVFQFSPNNQKHVDMTSNVGEEINSVDLNDKTIALLQNVAVTFFTMSVAIRFNLLQLSFCSSVPSLVLSVILKFHSNRWLKSVAHFFNFVLFHVKLLTVFEGCVKNRLAFWAGPNHIPCFYNK